MEEDTILSLTDYELFRLFIAKKQDLIHEKIIVEGDVDKVLYGIKIFFSYKKYFKFVDDPTRGVFRAKPKNNIMRVEGKSYDSDRFDEEIMERNGIMLNALTIYYSNPTSAVRPMR